MLALRVVAEDLRPRRHYEHLAVEAEHLGRALPMLRRWNVLADAVTQRIDVAAVEEDEIFAVRRFDHAMNGADDAELTKKPRRLVENIGPADRGLLLDDLAAGFGEGAIAPCRQLRQQGGLPATRTAGDDHIAFSRCGGSGRIVLIFLHRHWFPPPERSSQNTSPF